jgi:hypothetical protein
MRFCKTAAYYVGCELKKAAPKQLEKAGVGSVMPRSVPTSFAVTSERKKYSVCAGVSFVTRVKRKKHQRLKNDFFT